MADKHRKELFLRGVSSKGAVSVANETTPKKKKAAAIKKLRKLHPDIWFHFGGRSGSGLTRSFKMSVNVDGQMFKGTGSTKKQAKLAAVQKALKQISERQKIAPKMTKKVQALDQDKNPFKHLRQLHPDSQFTSAKNGGSAKRSAFTSTVTVIGMTFEGSGLTKKKAKHAAAKNALSQILGKAAVAVKNQSEEKNPILRLRGLNPNVCFIRLERSGPVHASVFTSTLRVAQNMFQGSGSTMKMSKHEAAKKALKSMFGVHL